MTSFAVDSFDANEIAVLEYLVGHRCMNRNAAKRWEAVQRDLGHKIPNLDAIIQGLLNKGAVGATKKGGTGKDHIWAVPEILGVLKQLGKWSPGRIHKM